MNAILRVSALLAVLLALATAATAAEPVTNLDVEALLNLARPTSGECYATTPPAGLANAPERLFTWASAGGSVTFRVPVPVDGYYMVRSTILWGPWADGRLGRFLLTAGGVQFPNAYQGWYGTPPNPPYQIRTLDWGIAHLSAPAVELTIEPAGGGGRLISLADLRLAPREAEGLKPEDLNRKVAAVVPETAAAGGEAGPAWPQFDSRQQRGTEWTVFVRRAAQAPQIDGKANDWKLDEAIVIDGNFVPERGWAAPGPESDADLSARVDLVWDDTHLYLVALVRDDMRTPHTDAEAWASPFACDSLVVNVAPPGWLTSGGRSQGPAPLQVMFGLSYYSPGATGRPLAPDCHYVVTDTADGYVLEAALSFASLGWSPAAVGDRFPLGLILVDVDPDKPAGKTFDQYGWNFGPGSAAGTGEARLMGAGPAAGEIIPERDTLLPGAPLRYVGTVDARGAATLKAIEVVPWGSAEPVASFTVGRALPGPGRYRLWGQLPLPQLPPGRYDLRMIW